MILPSLGLSRRHFSAHMYLMRVKCPGSTTLLDGEKVSTEILKAEGLACVHPVICSLPICSPDSRGTYLWRAEEMVCEELGPVRRPWRSCRSHAASYAVLLTTMPPGKKEELSNHFQPSV